jgi:N-acetylmuramoyl-L-alanine amidase
MQDNLVKHLGTIDRKVKTDKLVVLTSTTIPATLLEIDFLSNVETAHKLNSPDFQQEVAKSIYKGIQDVFSIYKPVR